MKLETIIMNKCQNCNVNIYTSNNVCPLCNNIINLKIDNSIYPNIKSKYKKYNLLMKIIIFLASCGIIFSILINYFINNKLSWSLFVILGIITFLITFINGFKKRNNINYLLITENIFIIILYIIWDL